MTSRSWPLVAVMALCACVAIGSSVYLLSGGVGGNYVIAALGFSIGLSAISSIVLAAVMANGADALRHQMRSDVAGFERRLRDDRIRNESLAHEMSELRELSNRTNATIASGFGELRESYATLNEQLRSTVSTVTNFQSARTFAAQMQRPMAEPVLRQSNVAAPPAYEEDEAGYEEHQSHHPDHHHDHHPGHHHDQMNLSHYTGEGADQAPHQAYAEPAPRQQDEHVDQLAVSLEPVVDLFTTKTAHYRLHLGMVKPEGGEVEHDVLLHHADRTGLRAEFDVFAAREALQLLQHLRQRDATLSIFMAIGPSTLQSHAALSRILEERGHYGDVADGLVLEIPHAMLAGLSDAGLEGLALLARSGVTLSLANAAVNGIDLMPLSKLNVRYISLSAVAAGGVEGPSPAMIAFTQNARAARIQAIVTGVVDRRVVAKLTKISRFASGPAFAPPRRVKSETARGHAGQVGIAA